MLKWQIQEQAFDRAYGEIEPLGDRDARDLACFGIGVKRLG